MQPTKSKLSIGLLLVVAAVLIGGMMVASNITYAAPALQESDDDTTTASQIYLPSIFASDGSTTDVPLAPDAYAAESEEAPQLADEQIQASTWCSTYIKFKNESSQTIKIYYVNSYGSESLYKTLSSGYYYWQHSYYGNKWKVKDYDGNVLKSFTVNTCSYVYVTIDNNDFPQPTATPTATPTSSGGGACYTQIISVNSNKCVDVAGVSNDNYAKIQQYSCYSGDNQQFLFSPVPGKSDTYVIRAKHSGKAIDVKYSSTYAGKELVQYSANGSSSQQWKVVNISGDIYELKNINSGLVADVENGSSSNGAQIIQWYDNNTNNQRWKIPGCLQPEPTATPVPPTATPTNTTVPPTATPTNTTVPPTATPTNTTAPQLGSIGDRVWRDINGNGQQDGGEPGVSGVTVQLKSCGGGVLQTTTTDGNGIYRFDNLAAGCYSIGVVLPDGFTFSPQNVGNDNTDSDINPGNAMSDNVNLGAGQNIDSVDAGLVPQAQNNAALGDKVFRDDNGNGIQDGGEPGVSGVTVQLKDCDNNVLQTTTTNGNGIYSFTGLAAGCYVVRFANIDDNAFDFSPANQGNDAADSDVVAFDSVTPGIINGSTANVNLAAGETNNTVDAGLVPQAQNNGVIGDKVFRDDNGNGIQDGDEPGVSGVTVQLKDCSNNVLQTTTTNSNGIYSFSGLAAGCYTIGVVLPGGFNFSPQDVGNDNTDSDINPDTAMSGPINLAAGETDNSNDAGLVPQGGGGEACIGDYVWNDMDYDGIQDSNEMGVKDAKIYVGVDNNGDNRIDYYPFNTITDANGKYQICGLDPTVTYIVEFVPPMGCLTFTLPNQGNDDTVDSDPDLSKGLVYNVIVPAGTTNNTIDAGLICNGD